MLIGLIADIHANVYGLKAALGEIHKVKPDLIICTGDIIGYYPFINETINLLREEQVMCLKGNHDAILTNTLSVSEEKWQNFQLNFTLAEIEPDNLIWLDYLPITRRLDLDGTTLDVYHGSPWEPLTEYIYPDYQHFERFRDLSVDYVALGHTHIPLLQQAGDVLIVNPGSCGQPRDYIPGACYGLLSTEDRQVELHRADYEIKLLTAVLQDLNYDQQLIDILNRTKDEDIL